jgi:hypothetical protein
MSCARGIDRRCEYRGLDAALAIARNAAQENELLVLRLDVMIERLLHRAQISDDDLREKPDQEAGDRRGHSDVPNDTRPQCRGCLAVDTNPWAHRVTLTSLTRSLSLRFARMQPDPPVTEFLLPFLTITLGGTALVFWAYRWAERRYPAWSRPARWSFLAIKWPVVAFGAYLAAFGAWHGIPFCMGIAAAAVGGSVKGVFGAAALAAEREAR